MTGHLNYASRSIRGKRKYQEDCCDFTLISDDAGEKISDVPADGDLLAVLADGMGGHVGGACASRTLCAEFVASFTADAEEEDVIDDGERLSLALDHSNQALLKRAQDDESLAGMGSTFIGAVFYNDGLHWISVGDSLLYLYRGGQLRRLNENHAYSSVLQSMVERGEITELEASKHPHRNALLSAVTGQTLEKIDHPENIFPLEDDDWVLIASDGILTLSEKEISTVIEGLDADSADDLVEALIEAVQEADYPKQDNTTIMAVHFSGAEKSFIDQVSYEFFRLVDRMSVQRATQWVASGIFFIIVVAISLIFASSYSGQETVEQVEDREDPIKEKLLMNEQKDETVVTEVPQK